MLDNTMQMRDVLSNEQPRQGISGQSIRAIRGNDAYKLDSFGFSGIQDGTPADTVYGDTVNQIAVAPGADAAGEEAKRIWFGSRIAELSHLDTDADWSIHRPEWYQVLWQIKAACRTKYHSGIGSVVSKYKSKWFLKKYLFRKAAVVNLERLLPFICMADDMKRSCDTAQRLIFVVAAQKTCAASRGRFDFDNVRSYFFDDFFPVHGSGPAARGEIYWDVPARLATRANLPAFRIKGPPVSDAS
jgi:hypothetical protein